MLTEGTPEWFKAREGLPPMTKKYKLCIRPIRSDYERGTRGRELFETSVQTYLLAKLALGSGVAPEQIQSVLRKHPGLLMDWEWLFESTGAK